MFGGSVRFFEALFRLAGLWWGADGCLGWQLETDWYVYNICIICVSCMCISLHKVDYAVGNKHIFYLCHGKVMSIYYIRNYASMYLSIFVHLSVSLSTYLSLYLFMYIYIYRCMYNHPLYKARRRKEEKATAE